MRVLCRNKARALTSIVMRDVMLAPIGAADVTEAYSESTAMHDEQLLSRCLQPDVLRISIHRGP